MTIISPFLVRICSKIFGFSCGAFTIFPFIFVRDQEILNNKEYMNHERIHLWQYMETLVIGLIIIALCEYLYAKMFLKMKALDAYYFMSHEQEAHQNDTNMEYLKQRKIFSLFYYINPKNKKKFTLVDGKRVIM